VNAPAGAAIRPFVTALRTPRGAVLRVGAEGGDRITVRVQFEALWDAIAVDVRADEPVATLVLAALARFGQGHVPLSDFVTKLHGWEVKDAAATVASCGARNGSTFLVAYRLRRPVR
jgi:hypothetical protein